ncbi:MAG TPA: BMP family protein [Vicinamibacterales bacterium]|nr:BMP family protein [Vicinamibacterales bacterium]
MRKLSYIAVAAVLAACAPREDGGAADTSFRVALLTPGPVSDQSWNGGAYQGLMRIRDSLGAEVSHVQTRTPADFEENFREYGSRGFDLVFGHGFEFQDAAKRVAPGFPATTYVTTSGNTSGGNVAGIMFSFADASYLAGILAGSMSRSGTVGVIGGTELPPVKESFDAFGRGVRSVRPNAQILTAFIGNWDDVSAGKEQALAQIGRGADVIFQNADAAGLGVFQAARGRRAVYVIGSNADQNAVAPQVTLGSVVIDLPRAFLAVAREVKDGSFEPRVVTFDARSDVVRLVLNPAIIDRIPPDTRAKIDSVNARIHAGTFTSIPH